MDVILMRHPPPQVASGVCYGSTDVPAEPARFDASLQAMQAALDRSLGDWRPPSAIFSSPLVRARDAAERIAAHYGMPLQVDARLAEMHFGTWEMQRWDDIGQAPMDEWANDVMGFVPPGGESAAQVSLRVRAWCRAALASVEPSAMAGPIVAITHGGPMRLLAAHVSPEGVEALGWEIGFGALLRLRVDPLTL